MNGIISKNVVNIYAVPDVNSELVSQAIMGSEISIVEQQREWAHVKTEDDYTGWMLYKYITEGYKFDYQTAPIGSLFAEVYQAPRSSSDLITRLVITSRVGVKQYIGRYANILMPGGVFGWVKRKDIGSFKNGKNNHLGTAISKTAKRFIGTPYLWGGSTPFGIDCSGFVQLVYKINGILIPRDSQVQYSAPIITHVTPQSSMPGDLVFFSTEKDRAGISHVGILLGNDRFIHSAGKGAGVVVGSLLDGYYANTMVGIGRYII